MDYGLHVLGDSYEWNRTTWDLMCLTSCPQAVFKIHTCCSTGQNFLPFHSWVMLHWRSIEHGFSIEHEITCCSFISWCKLASFLPWGYRAWCGCESTCTMSMWMPVFHSFGYIAVCSCWIIWRMSSSSFSSSNSSFFVKLQADLSFQSLQLDSN